MAYTVIGTLRYHEKSEQALHVAEAMLQKAHKTNMHDVRIAIQHAGGVRTDLLQGELTVADTFKLLPFGNTLVTLTLTGEQIQNTISDAAYRAASGANTGAFPYTAGLRYDYAFNGGVDSKITDIEVFDGGQWTKLLPHAFYRIVTNGYLVSGGDGYPLASRAVDRYDTGFVDADVFMEYAQSLETLDVPEMVNVNFTP